MRLLWCWPCDPEQDRCYDGGLDGDSDSDPEAIFEVARVKTCGCGQVVIPEDANIASEGNSKDCHCERR